MINYKELCGELAAMGISARTDYRLADYTSFKIGGEAGLAVFPRDVGELVETLRRIYGEGARCVVLGNGTNVLFDDAGYDGAVVILGEMKHFGGIVYSGLNKCGCGAGDGSSHKEAVGFDTDGDTRKGSVGSNTDIGSDEVIISADAGYPLTRLASDAAALSLTGLEFAYGIPGSVGGGIFMNAGAYGGELSDVVWRSRWYDPDSGETGYFTRDEHEFAYRHSIYMDCRRVILSAEFRLKVGDKARIRALCDDYMSRRREKQPLEYPSAGSVFKRGSGFITAKLIEDAGLKGCAVGGAQVSEKHAGFIINRGGATASDVLRLIRHIQATVRDRFGVEIECEVRYIPRD